MRNSKGRSKTPTFFNKKSEVRNASIREALALTCSKRVNDLIGLDYHSLFDSDRERVHETFANELLSDIPSGADSRDHARLIEAYAWARRYEALFQKNASLRLNIDTEAVAYSKFVECEELCKNTNRVFTGLNRTETLIDGFSVESILHMIRRKISYILGDVPLLEDLHCSFGPGANTTCRRRTSAIWKLSSQLAVSNDARGSLTELAGLYPRLNWSSTKIDAGLLSFVPKSAKTDRPIMVEPILNTFVQRGIGRVMKRRLSRAGCNLYLQERNRELARQGSIDNSVSTIDLSSASDTIAYQVVKELLPWEWYELLATWRTGIAYYAKEKRYFILEKFSSMGNGFTFELESCLFYAISLVACEIGGVSIGKKVSVYGDDIIIPRQAAPILSKLLDFLGFQVNKEKSFVTGPFRESCGADYVLGVDVRPFYLKDTVTDARLVAMANQVVRSGFPDDRFWYEIHEQVYQRNRLYGPDGFGDGHFVIDAWNGQPHSRDSGYEGYVFRTFTKRPKRYIDPDLSGHALYPAYVCHERDLLDTSADFTRESDPYVLRGGQTARVTRVYVPTCDH